METKQLEKTEEITSTEIERVVAAILRLVTREGIEASDDVLFKDAIFGRDSIIFGRDLVDQFPSVVNIVISSVIKHQGLKYNSMTEEEWGRIHHEFRDRRLGSDDQKDIYDSLVEEKGIGNDDTYIYYGSVDATPQFIRLIDDYRKAHGDEILSRVEKQGEGSATVERSVYMAASWLSNRIRHSELGLLEFCRTNPNGITYQALRDGSASYMHEDGSLANPDEPIASIEVQGLAYDALLAAAEMVGTDAEKAVWLEQAEALRATTFERFWTPEKNYWAMAIDRDPDGKPRQVVTETSLPAELLDTGFFDNLPEGINQEELIAPIVRRIFSPEFMTPIGTRMRGKQYEDLWPYSDYQGSAAVWPVSNNVIARGLRRYGMYSLAQDLECRILAGLRAAGSFPEFLMVKTADDGKEVVCWPLLNAKKPGVDKLIATNKPETDQAWTISAYLRILYTNDTEEDTAGWQQELNDEITTLISEQNNDIDHTAIVTRPYYLAQDEARAIEQQVLTRRVPIAA